MKYCFLILLLVTMWSCDFSKPIVNVHLKENQDGWCFILLDSSSNLTFQPVISIELDSKFNAACINKKYRESKSIFKIYNFKGELINDKLKFTAISGFSDGKNYFEFYVPRKNEVDLPAEYWASGSSSSFLLIDESISRANELAEENFCN